MASLAHTTGGVRLATSTAPCQGRISPKFHLCDDSERNNLLVFSTSQVPILRSYGVDSGGFKTPLLSAPGLIFTSPALRLSIIRVISHEESHSVYLTTVKLRGVLAILVNSRSVHRSARFPDPYFDHFPAGLAGCEVESHHHNYHIINLLKIIQVIMSAFIHRENLLKTGVVRIRHLPL